MRIRSFRRPLAPIMRITGEADEDGNVPVVSKRTLRSIRAEQRRRARERTPADDAALAGAEAKRERRRQRNQEHA